MQAIKLIVKSDEVLRRLHEAAFKNHCAIHSVRNGVYIVPKEVIDELDPSWIEWVNLTPEETERFKLLRVLTLT